MKYGNVDLVEGWLIVEDNKQATSTKPAQPPNRFKWNQREVHDCKKDLSILANNILKELQTRYNSCIPPLMLLLHECLDLWNKKP